MPRSRFRPLTTASPATRRPPSPPCLPLFAPNHHRNEHVDFISTLCGPYKKNHKSTNPKFRVICQKVDFQWVSSTTIAHCITCPSTCPTTCVNFCTFFYRDSDSKTPKFDPNDTCNTFIILSVNYISDR